MADIDLLIADVDGTLLTDKKVLSNRACRAVRRLRERGIKFTVTSGRPPRGMAMLVGPLELDQPLAAFNGGAFVRPDLMPIEEHRLPAAIARQSVSLLEAAGLDVWVYDSAGEWLVRDPNAPHVAHEAETVKFPPTVVARFDGALESTVKIVGVSDDPAAMQRAGDALRQGVGGGASATRSQAYYLDVTNPAANKGEVVTYFARALGIDPKRIATIGDMPNDVLMFKKSGLSIAMGNAAGDVRSEAAYVTDANGDQGFAKAVEHFLLGDDVPDLKAGRP